MILGKGKTLLPGLIDSHVHILYPQVLKQMLIFGVTTVVDMHMIVKTMQNIKKHQASGKANDMATLISAGMAVTAPRGHGTQFGIGPDTIATPEEAQPFVDSRIEEGSDFIKIMYDDGSALSSTLPALDKETLTSVIKATHKRGKLAVVHIMTLREAKEAIEAGADGLAHLYINDDFDEKFGFIIAQHDAFVIPTLTILKSISGISDVSNLLEDARLSPYLKQADVVGLMRPFFKATGKAGYETAEKAVKQLKEAGVSILAGTDSPGEGTAYGISIHHELEFLVHAGLTPVEALKTATSTPAKTYGLTDRSRIQPSFNADLLLVKGDPTEDITATRDIVAVWKNGIRIDRDSYRVSVAKEMEAIRRQKSTPPPEGSESGLISDFEAEAVTANFGKGWGISTDAIRGGKSKCIFRRIEGGAQSSKGSMLIKGEIGKGAAPWAGVMFSPGKTPMAPVNLSSWQAISFWVRGERKTYSIMIFARCLGFAPSIQTFGADSKWRKYTFLFEKFGLDGHEIWGIFIGGPFEKGEFALQVDNVRLE